MNAEIHVLTGAYAADALPVDERVEFERHLRICDPCGEEVREFQATTALLGVAAAVAPPPALKARVMAEIARTRQLGPDLVPGMRDRDQAFVYRPRLARWTRRAVGVGIAALVLAAAGLGVLTYQQRADIDELQGQLASALTVSEVMGAPDSTLTRVTSGELTGTVLASEQQDRAIFFSDGLPDIPTDRTYQLWVISAAGPVSAGLLSFDESGQTSPQLAVQTRDAQSIAVTVEPAGGSEQPTTTPLLLVELPA